VNASSLLNESIAALGQRINSLGEGVVKVAREVFDIIK
jgi:hypothetical protein